jgi:CHASE1-domain containing sensor protein
MNLPSEDMRRLYAELAIKTGEMTISEMIDFMQTGILPDECEEIEI